MEAPLKIYNTLSGEKEVFEPLNAPFVGMYVCGQTVYKDIHIGNLRTMISFDMIYRFLKHWGYNVRYVRNITDVGHLLGDVDTGGDDKLAAQARLEQLEPMEVAHKYTMRFWEAMRLYNVAIPNLEPRASAHVIEQIKMVEEIIDNGFAYVVNGSVYFDVMKFREAHSYGHLSGRVIEDLVHESRDLGGSSDKRNPVDFVLWRHTPPEHLTQWPSPWGPGVPGWHLECSVLSTKYLGEKFDIHGGGMDLKFPHHECEIAQNVGSKGFEPVKYWMHGNMLTIEGQKMSKSLNNVYSPWDLITGDHPKLLRGFDPLVVRFSFFQSHYRSTLDFSEAATEASEKGHKKLIAAYREILLINHQEQAVSKKHSDEIEELCQKVDQEMLDDFNTPKAIAVLFDLVAKFNKFKVEDPQLGQLSSKCFETLRSTFQSYLEDVFAIVPAEGQKDLGEKVDGLMKLIVGIRKNSRDKKDFETADKIRDTLNDLNIQLKDGREGSTWEY